ncbi:TlpA family protein disulfide reductase [Aquimarina rubra]|uniref:TlpA family protein disulfide reductase n=1 Tax=Aquimarina rubra TaxID=1920033 RepID=A0ABW5LJE4_9FLAO
MTAVSEGNKSPNAKIKTVDNSIVEIESFKGKLLIIDFWATWCVPCLKEAPLFKDIANKYKNSNAEFISISVDEDFLDWKNYVQEKKWNEKHYWFGMQEHQPFFSLLYSKHTMENKEMILMGIPKYVIISPTGEILSNTDLRPSKPEFEIEIKKYLKQ